MQASYLKTHDPKRKAPNLCSGEVTFEDGPRVDQPMGDSSGAMAQRMWQGPLGATHMGKDAEEIQTYIHAITRLHHPTAEKEKVERGNLHIV